MYGVVCWCVAILIFIALPAYILVNKCLKSPFSFPYFVYEFDVSRKRTPDIVDLIDQFLIDNGIEEIKKHQQEIERWKLECVQKIDKSILKKYRSKQYNEAVDDESAYRFFLVRTQTRYQQRNYQKTSYKVMVRTHEYSTDCDYLLRRYMDLEKINFECTIKAYHSKEQRKLATRELRERIMRRDNYTCAECGKYMPDEVGLQIDHIIPVSKGGKTVPSNLRVLCSRCNGAKSNK